MSGTDPERRSKTEIEADLHDTRQHLADSVDAVGERLNVKRRGANKLERMKREPGPALVVAGAVATTLIVLLVVRRRRAR